MNEEKILDFAEYSHSVEKKEALFAYIKDKRIIEEALNRFCLHFSVRNYGLKGIEKHLENKFTFLVKDKQEAENLKKTLVSFLNKKGIKGVKMNVIFEFEKCFDESERKYDFIFWGENFIEESTLKKSFERLKSGGNLFFSTDARFLFLPEHEKARILAIKSGKIFRIEKEEKMFYFLLSESKKGSFVLISEGHCTKQCEFKDIFYHGKFYI